MYHHSATQPMFARDNPEFVASLAVNECEGRDFYTGFGQADVTGIANQGWESGLGRPTAPSRTCTHLVACLDAGGWRAQNKIAAAPPRLARPPGIATTPLSAVSAGHSRLPKLSCGRSPEATMWLADWVGVGSPLHRSGAACSVMPGVHPH